MSVEYTPEFNLETSRARLTTIVTEQVEIEDQVLFESIVDILASRGGERWKKLDELWLYSSNDQLPGIRIAVGYHDSVEDNYENEAVWLEILQKDNTGRNYEVAILPDGFYELRQVNIDTDERTAVSNIGGLAAARLLSILADAHSKTPLEVLSEGYYKS